MADAKQGKTEDFYNGSSGTRVVLAKPRLGGFGSSSLPSSSNKSSNPFGSVLRPPQLKPSANPFLKVPIPDETKDSKNEKESPNDDRLKEDEPKGKIEAPMFVPLGSANASSRTANPVTQPQGATSTSNASSFVFGQNLSARVMMQENVNNGEASSDHSSSNGTTELLFTNAAASVKENNQETEVSTSEGGETSLAASAAEYERIHARPPPPAANFSHTGEEDEINVLQTTCRLFAWESGSWRERGRGVLRLNDAADGGGARLVVRVSGSLRVALNTKLWPDMVAERAGTKSLRITASDAQQQVKLYLIMGAPVDIAQIHRALTSRIAVSKRTSAVNQCAQNTTSQKAAERLEADYSDKTEDTGEPGKHVHDEPNDRIEPPKQKTEEYESNVDGMVQDNEANLLKRKEPAEDETSTKRQRAEIVSE